MRAARTARLFFLIQPIRSLICGAVVAADFRSLLQRRLKSAYLMTEINSNAMNFSFHIVLRSLKFLNEWLQSLGYDVNFLWQSITVR